MSERTEKIYVLFGSQTGNSEDAALTFAKELPTQLSPKKLQQMTGTKDTITVQPVHMQLDDFLEINKADWTRLVIIFVSSYGVGQAPLGCYRFRDLMDAWKERKEGELLKGVQFALCGLGDSSYTTFFQNPTILNEVMQQVGAKRIGQVGKADAVLNGTDKSQANVIAKWKEDLWKPLAKAVVEEPPDEAVLKKMQDETVELCCEINPDFEPPIGFGKKGSKGGIDPLLTVVPIIMLLVAIIAFFFLKK